MKSKCYGTYERYRLIAFAVLKQAVRDYYDSLYWGYDRRNILYDIDDMWFDLTNTNKEWFFKTVIKEGDRRYGEKFREHRH